MKKQSKDESSHRAYDNRRREQQAAETRAHILATAIRLMTQGDHELTYTSLAREAGVSVPTVYRNFPTRPELFEAIYLHEEARRPPRDKAEVLDRASIGELFARFDDPEDPLGKAPRLGAAWEFSRASTVPRRRHHFEALVDQRLPRLPSPQREWLIDLGVVLISSSIGEAFRGYLDRTGAETADRVWFALEALLAHAATLQPPESP